jgi:hypothetical protein
MSDHNPQNTEDESFDRPGFYGPPIRTVVCDWLRANGIDPAYVAADARASMADGQVTLVMKVRGPQGHAVIAPEGDRFLLETRTSDISVPPPPLVEAWLAPKCPTCGR